MKRTDLQNSNGSKRIKMDQRICWKCKSSWIFPKKLNGLPTSRNIGVWPTDWKRWAGSNLSRCHPSWVQSVVWIMCGNVRIRLGVFTPTDSWLLNWKKYCNNNNITVWTSSGSSGKFLLNRKSLQNRAAWPRVASVWIRMDPCDSCSCLQFKAVATADLWRQDFTQGRWSRC